MKGVAVLLVFLVCTTTADTLWGPYSGFNAITFGDFICAYSDIRGRLAVNGNTRLVNYDVACQANDPVNAAGSDQCPSYGSWSCKTLAAQGNAVGSMNYHGLIASPAGRTTASGTTSSITGGQVSGAVSRGAGTSSFTSMSDCAITGTAYTDSPFDFAAARSYFTGVQLQLKNRNQTGTVTNNGYGTLGFVGTGRSDIEVFNLDGVALSSANTLSGFTNVVAQMIVINVNGTSITLSGGNDGLRSYKSKIVWNFHQATSIKVQNYAVWGSVIAPNAAFNNPAGVFWGQLVAGSFVSGTFSSPSLCAQINWIPFTGPSIPPVNTNICGNGKIEAPEKCDFGTNNGAMGSCCSSSCTFVNAGTVCRAAAGPCDDIEKCTGTAPSCPDDTFLPAGTNCNSVYGICDLAIGSKCPGTSPMCIDNYPTPLFSWDAFNVISFNTYTVQGSGGDVEGALAVRNFINVSNFDAGLLLNDTDLYTLFTVVTAGNLKWTSGASHPEVGHPYPFYNSTLGAVTNKPEGYVGVGGNFTGPDYLQKLILKNVYLTGKQFDAAQSYYQTLQTLLSNLGYNANYTVVFGDGLSITCDNNTQDLYHVSVDGSVLSSINWYTTTGCKFSAGWIIDVTGTSNVTIKGGPFPGIVERVVYNVLGAGRVISSNTGVTGNILAPQNSFFQTVGVTYGRVIVGDVIEARQNNKPNCTNFQNVTITNLNLVPLAIGDRTIWVVNLGSYSEGDMVCVPNGQCKKIVGAAIAGPSFKRAVADKYITIEEGFSSAWGPGTVLTTIVDPNVERAEPIQVVTEETATKPTYQPTLASESQSDMSSENAAPVLMASAVVLALLALLF